VTTQRYSDSINSVAVATSVASSEAINFSDFETGRVHVPSGSSLTTLTWHASLEENGDYTQVRDSLNANVTSTVAAGYNYQFPVSLTGARFVKITGNAAGVVGVTLKD
jgi:hypothetical protein